MAEPARKVYDEDNEDKSLTAQDRAERRWGMHKPEDEDGESQDNGEGKGTSSGDSSATEDGEEGGGEESARGRADKRWGMGSSSEGMGTEELKDAEEAGGSQSQTTADKKEKSKADVDANDQDEEAEDGKGGRRGLRRVLGRRAAGLFGSGIGIFGAFSGFNFLQGPLQMIHFGRLLDGFHMQDDNQFANDRSNRLLRYLRYPNQPERRRLGFILNRYADNIEARWARKGYVPEYNGPGNRLSGFRISPDVDVSAFGDGVNISEPDADGFRRIEISDTLSGRQAKRVFSQVSRAAGYNRTVSAINTRVLGKRAGVSFKLFTNRLRRPQEKLNDFYGRVREEIGDYYKRGATALGIRASGADGADSDGDGEADPDPDSQGDADAGNDSADGVREDTDSGGVRAGRNRLADDLDRGGGIVSILCMAKAVASRYPAIQYANIVLPLLRQGPGIMSMGAQMMAGKGLNFNEAGAMTQRLFSQVEFETLNGGSWTTARSIQAQLGHNQVGPDMLPSARPSRIGNNRALNAINTITGSIPGFGTACSVSNNAIGGAIIDFATGGIGGLASSFLMEQILAAAGFDPIEFLARLIAGEEVDGDPEGAALGNFANYGTRIASNDAMIAMGGQELTDAQELELDNEVAMLEQEELQRMSVSDRLFSLDNPKSLASKLAFESSLPMTPSSAFGKLASLPLNILPSVGNKLASITTQPTYALANNNGYDYGFPMFNFTAAERDDLNNDPEVIANEFDTIITSRTQAEEDCAADGGTAGEGDCDWIPSNVAEFNEKYEKCFGAKIMETYGPDGVEAFEQTATVNYFSSEEEDPETGRPEYCDDNTSDNPGYYDGEGLGHSSRTEAARDMQVFRFYLADTVVGHSMLCYEGEEASCALFHGAGATAGSTDTDDGSLGISPDGFTFPMRTTKATIIGNSPRWCYQNQNNCHHHYNAADIFAPTGTPIVAARGGTVLRARDNDDSSVGSRVTIEGDDGNLYYYAHMGNGTIRVSDGETVTAGTELGRVGTSADAVGTDPHLHFDILPESYDSRPSCSGGACQSHPFINPQPALVGAFNSLPE